MPPVRPYDEDQELTRYVVSNYYSLFSDFERKVMVAIQSREKELPHVGPPEHKVRRRWGGWDDPAVVAALEEGPAVFIHSARDRVLKERATEIFVQRCARCSRIVATPRARQCLWCGLDWHTRP